MRILCTGGTGFLGLHVTRLLEEKGHDVISVGHGKCNLLDQDQAFDLFDETRPEIVFHLAAHVGGIGANQDNPARYWYANLQMGLNVLESSWIYSVPKLVMVGTVCSYPKYLLPPFQEVDLWDGYPEETNAPYGIAKKALLVGAQAYREQYGLNTIFLMPANLYGPGDNFSGEGGHVVADMIRKFHTEPITRLWGDGSPTRDFLYVEDAAEGIVKASELYNGSWPVNLGTGVEINMRDLANLIKRLSGYRGEYLWSQDKPNGQPRRVLDTKRAKELFGWEATTPLQAGLTTTVDWYRQNVLDTSAHLDKLAKH